MINKITEKDRKKLSRDGFLHVKSVLNNDEIDLINSAIDSNLKSPSPFSRNFNENNDNSAFFMDFNNWMRLPLIKKVCQLPKIIDLITDLTNSKKCWLFHDHVLVKSGNAIPTPVHHDRPYHIVKGDLNCSVWIPVGNVERISSLIFYKSSHKINKLFLPKAFIDGKNIGEAKKHFSDLDSFDLKKYKPVDFEMRSGDVLVFFNNCLHGSHSHNSSEERKALSVRYLLDGAKLTKKYVNATPPFDRMGLKITENGDIPETHFPLLKD